MANDPYSMCPCGSGKKLKFCCNDILPDLQRAFRLKDNQPDAAIKIFRDLLKKHPDKEVVARELISTLFENGQSAEARQVANDFLKAHPDNPIILLSLSEILLKEDGFQASRRVLHRTFQLCAKNNPMGVAFLASYTAAEMARLGLLMSAREHLALAVRMSTGERQKQLVLQLVSFESESSLPFMFRSAYPLLPVNGGDEAVQQDMRARKLSVLGCWEPAAILYNRLADAYPTDGAVWHNLGMCQAWDGRVTEAASSLHHAASLLTDKDLAIEVEALAQQLDLYTAEERYNTFGVDLTVTSMSELLTRLEADPLIKRNDSHDHHDCHHPDGTSHVAEMIVLSQSLAVDQIQTASQLPEALADLDLFDVNDSDAAEDAKISGPFIRVTAPDHEIDHVIVKLRGIAGDLISTTGDQEKRTVVEFERAQARPFDRRLICPDGMPLVQFRKLVRTQESQNVEEWLKLPLSSLGGKSALDAASDENLKTKLGASLLVMLAIASKFDMIPDLPSIRKRLNLTEPAEREIPQNAAIAAFSAVQYERMNVSKLTNSQLQEFTNRCSILGLRHLVEKGLHELVNREDALKEFGARRAFLMLSAIARAAGDLEPSFGYLDKARQSVEAGPEAFRLQLELDIRELSYRLDNPEDESLRPLLRKFRDRYLHKIPEIHAVIVEQLDNADCGHLASELEGGLAEVGVGSSSLWTPGSESNSGSGQSLWVPGQE